MNYFCFLGEGFLDNEKVSSRATPITQIIELTRKRPDAKIDKNIIRWPNP